MPWHEANLFGWRLPSTAEESAAGMPFAAMTLAYQSAESFNVRVCLRGTKPSA
jgi:hypothetical protein